MKRRLLDHVACPSCGGGLTAEPDGDTLEEGMLHCRACETAYPVLGGVPRLLPHALSEHTARTAAAFGWQWRHFVELHPAFEKQFLDWIRPLEPAFFEGKVVLDAGCGIGRHAHFASRFGAREVVALDVSDAVETAQWNIGARDNVHVVQGDLMHPPFRANGTNGFDFVYSIGVLHHLESPQEGFDALVRLLRPGGTIFVWVYGYEGNGFVRRFVEPLRGVTTRMPPNLLRAVAWPLAALLHALVKGIYGPLRGKRTLERLPLGDYLSSLADFRFRQNYTIVFDQLVAPRSSYIRRVELEEWFERAGLRHVELSWRNRNSWRARGERT